MGVKCILANCLQRRTLNSTISFHRFPADPNKRKLWLEAVNLTKQQLTPTSVVCSKHFKASHYYASSQNKKLLNQEAVPTLRMPAKKNITIKKKKPCANSLVKHERSSKTVKAGVKQIKKETEKTKNETRKLNSKTNNSTDNKKSIRKPARSKTVLVRTNTSIKTSQNNNRKKTQVPHPHESLGKVKTRSSASNLKAEKRKHSDGDAENKCKTDENELSKKVKKKEIQKPINNKLNETLPDSTSSNILSTTDKMYWTSIQITITEMQEKIKTLEKKSVQDEKKIENFQKVLLQQKQEEIKALIEGKENELLLRMDVLGMDYNQQRICRLCLLEKGGPLITLFQPKRKSFLIEKIKKWTGIEVDEEDGMPSAICYECSIQMERADWFKKRSEKADVLLQKYIQMKKTANAMREICKTVPLSEEDSEIRYSNQQFEQIPNYKIEIEDVFSLSSTPEENDFEVSVKEEIEDIICVNDNIKSTDICVQSTPDKVKMSLEKYKPKIHFCKKCNVSAYKCLQKDIHSLQCSECAKRFWDSRALKKHCLLRFQQCFVPLHKRKCEVCNVIFRWKWQLNIHKWQHTQVKCCLCMICEEQFINISQLKKHVAVHFC